MARLWKMNQGSHKGEWFIGVQEGDKVLKQSAFYKTKTEVMQILAWRKEDDWA